jgi:hypothetical protein
LPRFCLVYISQRFKDLDSDRCKLRTYFFEAGDGQVLEVTVPTLLHPKGEFVLGTLVEVVPVALFAEAAVAVAKEFVELAFPKLDSPLCGLGTRPKLLSVAGDTNPNGFEGLADVGTFTWS